MRELTTPEIRKRLLDILIVFREFCHENNLNFYLCAGTLLGAVRHGGFIPWDDDIDVAMLRDNYDKLLDIARDNPIIKDKYKIISYELGTSHYPFLKILDMETQTIQSFSNEGHNNSLWIDIFPFDDVSENTELRKKQYRKVGILREILMLNFAKFGEGKTLFKRIIKPLLIPFAKLVGVDKANREMIRLATDSNWKGSPVVGDVIWGEYNKEIIGKDSFTNPTNVKFEGETFLTMSTWKNYLTTTYGDDYMELPPESQRENHELKVWLRDSMKEVR